MSAGDSFFDTSVLLYLLSGDARKADQVEALLARRGVISVQVLNEFTVVALRKVGLPLLDIKEILDTVRAVCTVEPLTATTHERGMEICGRYRFSFYDSVIVAAALIAGAKILYSEDLSHGQVIDRRLRIVNPFLAR
jgi:predicted nucleic acid-binding protein